MFNSGTFVINSTWGLQGQPENSTTVTIFTSMHKKGCREWQNLKRDGFGV